ncbi:o-succinylbenzoate--CoA ligase [Vibrio penaeicida]|uniref:o-succinylbenzoate--CoA ligase n=1 Tax=Vibrio penaeicida TaxID=104609 RepID=UPI001F028720|nr:o-succinylbenzoate--CoA ligase [Vibrio penaeicida]
MRKWAKSRSDEIALVNEDESVTWESLLNKVIVRSEFLNKMGVAAGDVVACVGKNDDFLLEIALSCQEIGAIFAPIAPSPKDIIKKKLESITPALVFKQQPSSEWEYQKRDKFVPTQILPAISSLIFTSGTTGDPKAVAHTESNHILSATGLLSEFEFKWGDKWLLSLPLYHVSGLAILWRWLVSGATMAIPTTKGWLHDLRFVTHASLVSTQLKRLLDSGDLGLLKRVLLGGSHIPSTLIEGAQNRGIDTWMGYGLTEAASTVTAKRTNQKLSSGKVLPNRDIQCVEGEIRLRGGTLSIGYYRQGQVERLQDDDGWFSTGDLGYLEEDELIVVGRKDNRFISGGENIHCEEIEAVLNTLIDIRVAIVIPIKDEVYGYRPVAVLDTDFLEPKKVYESTLVNKLEKFKWPIEYHLMPSVTQKHGGVKVSRKWLATWLENRS